MVVRYKTIKVAFDDVETMRNAIKAIVIKKYPELEESKITDRVLFNIIVKNALGEI